MNGYQSVDPLDWGRLSEELMVLAEATDNVRLTNPLIGMSAGAVTMRQGLEKNDLADMDRLGFVTSYALLQRVCAEQAGTAAAESVDPDGEPDRFVEELRSGQPATWQRADDASLVGLGEAVCSDYSNGADMQSIADQLSGSGLKLEAAQDVALYSIVFLCPQHSDLLTRQIESNRG